MTNRRVPFWLSPKDFDELAEFLASGYTENEQVILEDIRIELGVAKLRAASTSINLSALTAVLGLDSGSTPIHLSLEEQKFLLGLKTLPEGTRAALS